MSEKSILAYFKSPEEAEGVSKKLQSLRIVDMSMDRFSRYPDTSMYSTAGPLSGGLTTLSTATYASSFNGETSAILAASDPSASGMSDGGQGGPTGRDILLTVVVDEESFDKAMRILEEAGGIV